MSTHRLMGGSFYHRRPECAGCKFRQPVSGWWRQIGWTEKCEARSKVLCCDRTRRAPCALFAPPSAEVAP